ncbi:OstA-like protein [Halalkalibaculum sp. DA384]|uniref:OstA-like protein n=1 Tax=Halalkalibaculum sp. DA384 TaxID=3373606 RepID=UPI00375413AA
MANSSAVFQKLQALWPIRRPQKILLSALCIVALTIPKPVEAQNQVTINQAEEVIGATVQGERVRKLIGEVSLRTDDMVMYCDSAYQYLEKNEVRAFGNIEIDTPEEQIYADTLVYFTDVDFSQLRGRVIIEADSATLFSQAVDYRFSTKVGHFLEYVRLEDQEGVLTANSGFYYREPDSAVFRGDVQIADSLQYVEGDSLFINRQKETYRLYGNIFVDDRENNVMLKGDSLKADTVGHRKLEGDAWLKKFGAEPDTSADSSDPSLTDRSSGINPRPADSSTTPDSIRDDSLSPYVRQKRARIAPPDSINTSGTPSPAPPDTAASDTTHIRARTIYSIQETTDTDTISVINAYQNVRIWSPKFSAVADTARYDDQTENFVLRSNPTAWHKQVQLTGPYIRVRLENGEIDQLVSFPVPFVVQQDTAIDRLNQITGDTLRVNFIQGEISRIHVAPNGQLLRFTKNENDEPDGAVEMTAPSITLLFEAGALDSMKALGPVDGMYLPESQKTAERRLDGFTWTPELRPQRPREPMKRRLPPIPEDPPFELPARYRQAHMPE